MQLVELSLILHRFIALSLYGMGKIDLTSSRLIDMLVQLEQHVLISLAYFAFVVHLYLRHLLVQQRGEISQACQYR